MSVGVAAGEGVEVLARETPSVLAPAAGSTRPQPRTAPPEGGVAVPPGRLGAEDLAEILSRFSQASDALQRTHETLQAEVTRLTRELGEANEELQRSRRLAALGEIAAGIAHEVRNPLASIALDARMLAAEVAERAEARAAADRIGTSVRGLDRVVGDVLCFARETKPRVEATDAAELIERAIGECGAFACAAGVELVVVGSDGSDQPRACASGSRPGADGGAGGGVIVWCDPELAHRGLTNLVRNAIEAVSERVGGGERRVVVGCGRRAGAGRGGRGEGVLVVRDTGPGIAPGVLDRMFNPFFTTRAAGTGLGLAIVHRIMDAHGGRVEARNNVDVGLDAGVEGRADGCVEACVEGGTEGDGGGARGATFELVFPEPSVRGRPRRAAMEKDR